MKKIIDGKKYDTEKAVKIGEFWNGCNQNDFAYVSEDLYKTPRSGQYFLHGVGGARSEYAEPTGSGNVAGGEKIIPMSRDEAYAWAEKNLKAEEIEAEFSDMIEDA